MTEKLYWGEDDTIARIGRALRDNQVVAGASDTIPGLLAAPCQQGFLLLNSMKGRQDKPYLILIGSKDCRAYFVDEGRSFQVEKIINACWPGPVTIIFKAKVDLPAYMRSEEGTVALRMPDHEGLLELLSGFKGLFSTSANRAKQPVPNAVDEIDPTIIEKVAYLVADRKEMVAASKPSTILDCSGEKIKVVREGAYSIEKLQEIVGAKLSIVE